MRGDRRPRRRTGARAHGVRNVGHKIQIYNRDGKRVSHSTVDDIPWLFHALVVGSLGLWAYYRVMPTEPLILRQGIAFFCVAFAGVFVARAAARRLASSTQGARSTTQGWSASSVPSLG